MRFKLIIALWCGFLMISANASTSDEPPATGNFALPRSQRPASFYSFGSNIIDKGQLLARTTPNLFKTTEARYIGSGATLLYGTSSNSSLLFSLPMTPSSKDRHEEHSGFGDGGLQGEYAFYQHSSVKDTEQAAIISGFTLPSGTSRIGVGTFSYFIGGVYHHVWKDWVWFAAPGLLQFRGNPTIRLAPRGYYELGVGRNIAAQSGEYIFTGFLEVNGQYDGKNPSRTPVTRSSGGSVLSDGNLLFFSPSLWLSTQHWAFEFGVSLPITQHWIGTRNQVNYYLGSAVAYTFN